MHSRGYFFTLGIRGGDREIMSILADLTALLDALGIPVETGTFKAQAPDTYMGLMNKCVRKSIRQ
jgi:hypothetical protein